MGYGIVGREPRRFWEEVIFFPDGVMKWLTLSWLVGRVRGMEIRFHFSILFSVIITYLAFSSRQLACEGCLRSYG